MRRPHWLARNSHSESVHAALWVDTETDQVPIGDGAVEHHLRFGWACFQRTRKGNDWTEPEWTRFEDYGAFWDLVESKVRPKTRLFIFAHNWSFDGPVLSMFDQLPERGWRLVQAVIDGPPIILVWRKGSKTLKFLDTLNWWRMPLARIGESLSLPKLKMPGKRAGSAAWDRYARNDVEIIRRAVLEWLAFLDHYDLGTFGPTLASQAIRAFRHRFMAHDILIDDNAGALQLARESLHGGRTEAFRIGRVPGPVHCLDVNSMYPAVMADGLYPTTLRLFAKRVSLVELRRWLSSHAVVAMVQLETSRNRFAHVHNKRLVFPVGRIRTALTTPDLIDALKHGEIVRIESAAVYDQAPIFKGFVEQLYRLRQDAMHAGDNVRTWLLKILMNSLYGKFAQRGQKWETTAQTKDRSIASWREVDVESGRVFSWRRFAGQVQLRSVDPEALDSHPAIAAHITARARSLLWDLIQLAGPQEVLYVDTDSLWTTEQGRAALHGSEDPKRLGALKHEGCFQWFDVFGAKDYATPEKRAVKGVRTTATWRAPNVVEQEQWSSLAGLLAAGRLSAPVTRPVVKTLRRIYEKGDVHDDGAVSPLTLREW